MATYSGLLSRKRNAWSTVPPVDVPAVSEEATWKPDDRYKAWSMNVPGLLFF